MGARRFNCRAPRAHGRREEAGRASVSELRALGAEAEFVQADVRHEEDIRRLVDQTVACFCRLDVAVNNAGTEGKPGPVTDQTIEDYTKPTYSARSSR
jgi:NAD(P)-dependent dehydrogenase (short-subunit alcohol dehydrogenase family)